MEHAPGLWCWSAPHPQWASGHGWEAEVWAYCVEADDALVLVDPITPTGDGGALLAALIETCQKPVAIALSRAGHFRDSARFARDFGASIYGHLAVAERVPSDVQFHAVSTGDVLPGAIRVLAFDVPGLDHTPLYLPSHRAIVPGDILVRAEGALRLWWVAEDDADVRYVNERHVPALRRWLDSPVDHILTSHGEPVLGGGGAELAAAFSRPPWAIS